MDYDKEKLDFDFEFLDQNPNRDQNKAQEDRTRYSQKNGKKSAKFKEKKRKKSNVTWWPIIIIGFITIMVLSSIFDNNDISTTTKTNPQNSYKTKPIQSQQPSKNPSADNLLNIIAEKENEEYMGHTEYMMVGEYRCSILHYNKAGELEPSKIEEATLDSERVLLENRSDSLDSLQIVIKNMHVDEYSQWSIDNYNNKINDYNARLILYQNDVEKLENKIDNYNRRVKIYNNYLTNNCTKAR